MLNTPSFKKLKQVAKVIQFQISYFEYNDLEDNGIVKLAN